MYYQVNSDNFLLFILIINSDWALSAVNKTKIKPPAFMNLTFMGGDG